MPPVQAWRRQPRPAPGTGRHPGGPNLRLYCFTFAGGGIAPFIEWRRTWPNGVTVCPVEYPGHGSRWHESSGPTIRAVVETISAELRNDLHRPYAFLGHSFGAIVAHELARLLSQTGGPLPVRLFISAARAPHLPFEMIHQLPEDQFLERLIRFEGVPRVVLENRDALALLLPIVRRDFQLLAEHTCSDGEPLAVPISVFGGLRDLHVSPADLLAWSSYTSKSFRSRFFPGNHFFLFDRQVPVRREICQDLGASVPDDASSTPGTTGATDTPPSGDEVFHR